MVSSVNFRGFDVKAKISCMVRTLTEIYTLGGSIREFIFIIWSEECVNYTPKRLEF